MEWTRNFGGLVRNGLVVLAVLALAGAAMGQSRATISGPSSPGNVRSPGGASNISSFNTYSYGAGSVGSHRSGTGGNVLRSTIQSSVRTNLTTSVTRQTHFPLRSNLASSAGGPHRPVVARSGGSMTAGAPGEMANRTVQRYTLPQYVPLPRLRSAGRRVLPGAVPTADARTYLDVLASRTDEPDQAHTPIESLAPRETGLLRDYMLEGEQSFRQGEYLSASRTFELAHRLEPSSPDAVLSMFHARFATSMVSYSSAAYLLGRALQMTPELPMAPIQPRVFYGRIGDYSDHLDKLDTYCQRRPRDPAGWFVLAYFRWFEDDAEGARLALDSAAETVGNNEHLREAIDIFADGMTASGRLPGEGETTDPSASPPDSDADDPNGEPADTPQ